MLGLALRLLVTKRNDVILCTECQLCISRCPGRNKGINAFQGMMWAKAGVKDEAFYQEFDAACTRCGMCGVDCPRGLQPFALLPERAKRRKEGVFDTVAKRETRKEKKKRDSADAEGETKIDVA